MAVHRSKPPQDSRVFEQVNLARMKKVSESVQLAGELMRDARYQIEEAHRLVDESRKLRSWSDRHGREHSAQDPQKPR